ncbi:hypothetical protein [Metamycoplasma gateae]|uniref:DUF3899 domain-containing protein n=1 Tax=Metamycoplasma gateae TaxID=35769 RepID=A0ABZ2AIA7_9BACT|nr:hypothetical protein V2E26_00775 [Metamycoplasma gateae]
MSNNKKNINTKGYWKRSWTIGNIIYFFTSIFLMILMILLTGFLKKQNVFKQTWSNAITVGTITFLSISILVLMAKKGVGKGLIKPLILTYHNIRISSRAKNKYAPYMNQFEKDKILAKERKNYQLEQDKKNLNKLKNESTNLASYLIIASSVLVLTIGLMSIHLS